MKYPFSEKYKTPYLMAKIMGPNEYAISDRRAMEAGGGQYLNFIRIVLRKKM